MSDRVRAAVLVAPGRYEVQEFPRPALADGAALVRMEMSGICGTDKHTYPGETKQYAGTPAEKETPFPIIQGHENVGMVEEIAPLRRGAAGVRRPAARRRGPGDPLPGRRLRELLLLHPRPGLRLVRQHTGYGNNFSSAEPPHLIGGWAEYLYLRPDSFVYKVPDGLPPRVAVLAEVMACTASLDKLKEFSSYALRGVQLRRHRGGHRRRPARACCMIAKARDDGRRADHRQRPGAYRLDWARRCGADETLDGRDHDSDERIERVRELTGGRGADVVLHMANTPASFVEGIEMLKRGGMMLEMGNFADTGETSLNVHRHVCSKNIRLIGLTNHPSTGYGPALRLLERYADRYPFAEMVSHEFGLADAETAMRTSMSPDSMKVVIVPGRD